MKENTYKQILNQCVNNIKQAANNGELMCIFKIPKFKLGSEYPMINIESCASYIKNNLANVNKNVNVIIIENILILDWRKKSFSK